MAPEGLKAARSPALRQGHGGPGEGMYSMRLLSFASLSLILRIVFAGTGRKRRRVSGRHDVFLRLWCYCCARISDLYVTRWGLGASLSLCIDTKHNSKRTNEAKSGPVPPRTEPLASKCIACPWGHATWQGRSSSHYANLH